MHLRKERLASTARYMCATSRRWPDAWRSTDRCACVHLSELMHDPGHWTLRQARGTVPQLWGEVRYKGPQLLLLRPAPLRGSSVRRPAASTCRAARGGPPVVPSACEGRIGEASKKHAASPSSECATVKTSTERLDEKTNSTDSQAGIVGYMRKSL